MPEFTAVSLPTTRSIVRSLTKPSYRILVSGSVREFVFVFLLFLFFARWYVHVTFTAQRAFTVQPADFTSYVLRASTVRAPAGFDCVLASYQPNGVRPVVGWEIVQSDGTREFHDPRQSGGRFVALQLDHHGYLQIVDPQTADNGTRVRCVATSSLNPSEMAALSDWASILVSGTCMRLGPEAM